MAARLIAERENDAASVTSSVCSGASGHATSVRAMMRQSKPPVPGFGKKQKKQAACRDFQRGQCKRGKDCRYAHVLQKKRQPQRHGSTGGGGGGGGGGSHKKRRRSNSATGGTANQTQHHHKEGKTQHHGQHGGRGGRGNKGGGGGHGGQQRRHHHQRRHGSGRGGGGRSGGRGKRRRGPRHGRGRLDLGSVAGRAGLTSWRRGPGRPDWSWGLGHDSDYTLGEKLGQGSYGRVFRATHNATGRVVAIKELMYLSTLPPKMLHQGFPRQALMEIRVLKALRHPNIIELVEMLDGAPKAGQGGGSGSGGGGGGGSGSGPAAKAPAGPSSAPLARVLQVFEFVPHDLTGLLNNAEYARKLTEPHLKCLFKQLLEGVAFMHDQVCRTP